MDTSPCHTFPVPAQFPLSYNKAAAVLLLTPPVDSPVYCTDYILSIIITSQNVCKMWWLRPQRRWPRPAAPSSA